MTFEEKHPFLLSDGRRFTTLVCAGHSCWCAAPKLKLTATDTRTGVIFESRDCIAAYRDRNSAEWAMIADPMKEYLDFTSSQAGRNAMDW